MDLIENYLLEKNDRLYVKLDEQGYFSGITRLNPFLSDELKDYTLVNSYPCKDRNSWKAYRYINEQWILDDEKSKKINEDSSRMNESEVKNNKIFDLKKKLLDTDYIVIKISEGVANKEDYEGLLKQRQMWRNEINELMES